jgi:hypothetical protein
MACTPLYQNGQRVGFICSRGRARTRPCVECGTPSTKLCDYPLEGKRKGKTCDRPLCDACAVTQPKVRHIGTNTDELTTSPPDDTFDLCPAHARHRITAELNQVTLSYATPPKLVAPLMAPAKKERA